MINELSDGEVAEGIYTLSQAIRLCLAGEHNCVQRSAVGPVPTFMLLLFVLSKSQFKKIFSKYERARHWAYRLL